MLFFGGKKSAGLAAAAAIAVGFSTVLLCSAPATALPGVCGVQGVSLGGGICEATFTSVGAATFTPVANTTQLEALLVGGGGSGNYGYGGGGGEVKVVGFSGDTSTALNLVVGAANQDSSVTQGVTTTTALAGGNAISSGSTWASGVSGNGNNGAPISNIVAWGGGGGAGASPVNQLDGGAGATIASVAPSGSLFSTDTNCYGGGGAVAGTYYGYGVATCGGGYAVAGDPDTITAATPNTGGGGSGEGTSQSGASGLVVVRWMVAVPVTASFNLMGHGSTIVAQSLTSGGTATQPADPSATGFVFNGWFTDTGLTTRANFATPVSSDTTYYASWSAVVVTPTTTSTTTSGATLAFTGANLNPFAIPLGASALLMGVGLIVLSRRRAAKS